MVTYVLLLRGINLGRTRRVAMADLRETLRDHGYGGVTTVLQSGNVVLTADGSAGKVARDVETLLEKRFGFPIDVVIRTGDELLAVVATDPLGDVATDGARYLVVFLAERAGAGVTRLLESIDAGDERYAVEGRELYLWCPNGQLNSPLMGALGKAKDGPVATVRNWNTVRKLAAKV